MPVTETHYTDDELGLGEGWDNGLDANFAQLRRRYAVAARELKEVTAKQEAQARELILLKAGIPAGPRGAAFAKLYEGELSDPAAVKAEYEALFGPIPAAGSVGEGDDTGKTNDPNLSAEQRIADAGTNADQKPGVIAFEDALKAAAGDPEKIKDLIRHAPPGAGIALAED